MALNQSVRHHKCKWDARKIALGIVLTGIIAAASPLQAQTQPDQAATSETPSPTTAPSPTPENAEAHAAGNTVAGRDKHAAAGQAKADPWGPVPTKDVSVVNSLLSFCHTLTTDRYSDCQELWSETSRIELS